jgi:hypothetical protein
MQRPGRRIPPWALLAGALFAAGCTVVLDSDRHLEEACEAAPTPACGQPIDEACPPRVPSDLAALFPGRTPLGVLHPTTVLDLDAYGPDIAMASVPLLGADHGTTVILAMARASTESPGGARHRPIRLDVPLHDFLGASPGALPAPGDAQADLADTAWVTSVATHALRNPSGPPRVVLHLGGSADDEKWSGFADLATLDTTLTRQTGEYHDHVGAVRDGVVTRSRIDDSTSMLERVTIAQGGATLHTISAGVPIHDDLRLVATTSAHVMLQDGDGRFWFWRTDVGDEITEWTAANQAGRAAWVHASEDDAILAHQGDGTVTFSQFLCNANACTHVAVLPPIPSVSTMAPGGEVPDGVALADGRVAVLITERHDGGDRLVLQVLDANLTSFSLPRISLLDLTDSGERVTDARLDRVETATASTLVVVAAVGPEVDAASRVVMTGLRACAP